MIDQIKPAPGRPRSLQSQEAILQATLDVLRDVGYQKMSIESIAQLAGVGKTTIYRWYQTKEELVADALNCYTKDLQVPNTGALCTDIEALLVEISKHVPAAMERQTAALTMSTLASNPRLTEVYWVNYIQPRRKALSAIFERAKERGELRAEADIELIHDIIHGAVFFMLVMKPDIESKDKYVRRVLQELIRGIGSNPYREGYK